MAPTRRPISAKDRNGGLKLNSLMTGVRISPANSWRNIRSISDTGFSRAHLRARRCRCETTEPINLERAENPKTYANHPKPATTNKYHYHDGHQWHHD